MFMPRIAHCAARHERSADFGRLSVMIAIVVWLVAALLGVFTLRRLLFLLASLAPRHVLAPSRSRSVAVLVAARNEETHLPDLLGALAALDYPRQLLEFVIVSDGSTDATALQATEWAARTPGARALILSVSGGKGAALEAAREVAAPADLVAVFDADTVPRPDALAQLVGAFDHPAVGAACGYPDPGFDHVSIAARYGALERWVSHLVALAGMDQLGLQPPVIGAAFCVRSTALAEVGGFATSGLAEDIQLTIGLGRTGWKTRWIGEAVVRENVPGDLADLRRQRLRWSRGLMASIRSGGVENILAATGYLDRIAFVGAVVLTLLGLMPVWVLVASIAVPALAIVAALRRARAPRPGAYLWSVVPMAFADIGVTIESAVAHLSGAKLTWRARMRAPKP